LTIGLVILGIGAICNVYLSSDRVNSFANTPDDLKPNEIGWIGFPKSDLENARNIKLSTDVDINAFVVEMEFANESGFFRFRDLLKSAGTEESLDCTNPAPRCDDIISDAQSLSMFTLKRDVGVFRKVYWFADKNSLKVVGSTGNPPHISLR
jgi:hypothetical protein